MLKDELTDYMIHAGGEQIRCHKMVVAEASPLFSALFSLNKDERDLKEIKMGRLHAKAVRDVVKYCYDGQLEDVPIILVKEYLAVVKLFNLKELFNTFDTFLVDNIMEASCLKFFSYANRFDLSKSKDAALNTILSNPDNVKNRPELDELSFDDISTIVSTGVSNAENKENLLQMSIKYLTSDEKRGKEIDKFVKDALKNSCSYEYVEELRERCQTSLSSLDESDMKVMKNLKYPDPDQIDKLGLERAGRMVVCGGVREDGRDVEKAYVSDLNSGECKEMLQLKWTMMTLVCATKHGLFVSNDNKCALLNLSTLT